MLPFFWYMLKVIICSGILFTYYWLFLRNKLFHQYNRFYLLAAMSLSLLLPLLKIDFWSAPEENSQAIRMLQVVSAGDDYMNNVVIASQKSNWSVEQLYPVIYWLVSFIFFAAMIRTIILIRNLLKTYPAKHIESIIFINTENDKTPFSFFRFIFWNSSIDMNTVTGRQIFKHEVAHIEERHTHDKFFVNIILIFCWCNPFFWLYRKELNMIHEFIADKKAVEDGDTSAFAAMILQAAYPKHRFELTNNFFYSPIKRRLLMLTKNSHPKVTYIGRIMVLPLAILVFAAFTFKTKANPENPAMLSPEELTAAHADLYSQHNTSPEQAQLFLTAMTEDTLPATAGVDPEKALLVINGKIVGKGKSAAGEVSNLNAESISVKWLSTKDAMVKYGTDGIDGACEITYQKGAVFTTAYTDINRVSVLYIGVDNPVKISVTNVRPEDLVAHISEGWISGSNGNYMVRVTKPGDITISLSEKDGTALPTKFKLKAVMMPDPVDTYAAYPGRLKTTYDSVHVINLKLAAAASLSTKTIDSVRVVKGIQLSNIERQNQTVQINEIKKDNPGLAEVVVVGHPTYMTKTDPKEEVVVSGFQTARAKPVQGQEVVVSGYGTRGTRPAQVEEVVVQGYQATRKPALEEVVVSGYPAVRTRQAVTENGNVVFVTMESIPQFPGGKDGWRKFLTSNIKANVPVDNGAPAGKYTVVLKFIVNADGTLSDISCDNDPGYGTCAEAIRLMKTSPKWVPGMQNGKKVRAYTKQPITFVVSEDNDAKPVNKTSLNKFNATNTINQLFAFNQQYKKDIKVPACVGLDFTATYSGKTANNAALKNK